MRRISSREYYKQFSRKTGRYFAAKREDMNRPSRGTGSTTYESIVPAADSEIPSASSNTSHFMVQDDHKHPSTASQGVSDHIPAHPCSSEVPLSVVLASSNSNTHMDFEPDDGPYHDFHHDQQLPSASNLAIPSELLSPFNAPLSPLSNFLATHAPGPGERQNTHECICRRGWQCWVNDICKDSVVVEGERCQVCTVSISLGFFHEGFTDC